MISASRSAATHGSTSVTSLLSSARFARVTTGPSSVSQCARAVPAIVRTRAMTAAAPPIPVHLPISPPPPPLPLITRAQLDESKIARRPHSFIDIYQPGDARRPIERVRGDGRDRDKPAKDAPSQEFKRVGNGWISMTVHQAQGYSLVPVY